MQLQNRVPLINKTKLYQTHHKPLQQPYTLNYSDTSQNSFPKRDPIDKFIDDLIEGEETSIRIETRSMDMQLALKQEYEARHVPAMELIRFNGNPVLWSVFIDNFYQNVHSKMTFLDNIRMIRLISLLDRDAKRAIQSIGWSGLFYASALKTLKRDFGNLLLVATLRMKGLFNKPQISGRDHSALREFHQQLKMNNTWLMSMGYETTLLSSESLTKSLMRLLYNLHQEFFKATRDCNLIDASFNLIVFENWLDRKLFQSTCLHHRCKRYITKIPNSKRK